MRSIVGAYLSLPRAPTSCPWLPAERDEGEFARLSQLGDVLGLTQMDVYQVGDAGEG